MSTRTHCFAFPPVYFRSLINLGMNFAGFLLNVCLDVVCVSDALNRAVILLADEDFRRVVWCDWVGECH